MSRVLWVSGQSERYGGDVSLAAAVQQLRRRGWDITVTVPGEGWLTETLQKDGVPVERVDPAVVRRVLSASEWASLVSRRLPTAARRIRRLASSHDLVHVNSSVILGGLVGARLSRRPVVCHLRESYADHPAAWRLYGPFLRATSDAVIAVSGGVADEARRGGLEDRTEVIHNGVDLGPLAGSQPDGRYGPIVMVGRINGWKGQPDLVRAVRSLHDRGHPVEVKVAGDVFRGGDRYRRELVDLIRKMDLERSVELLGYVHDVPRLLTGAGVYVQPSARPEPFGLALVEAMAAGLPCVATDAGGPRDIIDHGRTGLLVPARDPGALADALEQLVTDPSLRRRLGAAAKKEAFSRFTPAREADGIEALYRRLLGGSHP